MPPAGAVGTMRSIHRYPVKSMTGNALVDASVGPRGVIGDRAYAIVDQPGSPSAPSDPGSGPGYSAFAPNSSPRPSSEAPRPQ